MMARLGVWVAIATVTACASSQPDDRPLAPETMSRLNLGGPGRQLHNEPGIGARLVDAPIDSVWLALPRVYELLGIPDVGADPETMTLGNTSFQNRRIEGERLSTFVDCGSGVTAMPNADTYQVTLSLLTRVTRAEDGGTLVVTTVDGTGKPRAVAGNPVHCQSKGRLEMRVAQLVMWVLVGGR